MQRRSNSRGSVQKWQLPAIVSVTRLYCDYFNYKQGVRIQRPVGLLGSFFSDLLFVCLTHKSHDVR